MLPRTWKEWGISLVAAVLGYSIMVVLLSLDALLI